MSARTKEQTRQLMLETGKELLQERGVPAEMPIKLSDVLARLRLTTGAAYHIWDSQDAYRRDLTLYVAETISPPLETDIDQLLKECERGDFCATIRAAASEYLQRYVDADIYTRLYFWAIKDPSTDIRDAAAAAFDANTSFATLCEAIMTNFNRKIADTASPDALAAATIALLDGFSLRTRFETPQDADKSFNAFGDAVAVYLDAVTAPA